MIAQNLETLQKRLNYFFNNKALLKQALTHKSANIKHNERLEFLGDAILNLVVADLLFQLFDKATEGELTRARASLVKQLTLAEIAIELSLGDYLQLGMGEQRSGGFRRESILADALEAVIGAIYLDAENLSACKDCIKNWFATRIMSLNPEDQAKDPKTRLQEWLQANQKPLPKYEVISTVGDPHSQVFTVSCCIEGLEETTHGTGASRRFAEQQAADKILKLIEER